MRCSTATADPENVALAQQHRRVFWLHGIGHSVASHCGGVGSRLGGDRPHLDKAPESGDITNLADKFYVQSGICRTVYVGDLQPTPMGHPSGWGVTDQRRDTQCR